MRPGVARSRKNAMWALQIANFSALLDDRSSIVNRSVVHNYDFVFTGGQRLRSPGLQTTRQYIRPL
jgi:hypothetical protein